MKSITIAFIAAAASAKFTGNLSDFKVQAKNWIDSLDAAALKEIKGNMGEHGTSNEAVKNMLKKSINDFTHPSLQKDDALALAQEWRIPTWRELRAMAWDLVDEPLDYLWDKFEDMTEDTFLHILTYTETIQ